MEIGDKSGCKEAIRTANKEKIKHLEQVQKERDRRHSHTTMPRIHTEDHKLRRRQRFGTGSH